jgi:hypothetical protein
MKIIVMRNRFAWRLPKGQTIRSGGRDISSDTKLSCMGQPIETLCLDERGEFLWGITAFEWTGTAAPEAPTPTAVALADQDWDQWLEAVGRDGVRIPYGDEYLRSTHWELMREAYLTGRCAECKRQTRTELHHVTYARVGHERPEDLLELCRVCHDRRHFRKAA